MDRQSGRGAQHDTLDQKGSAECEWTSIWIFDIHLDILILVYVAKAMVVVLEERTLAGGGGDLALTRPSIY